MTINLSCIIYIFIFNLLIILATKSSNETSLEDRDRQSKVFGVFNVVTFPNSACGASNGYNGTCFTSSECTAKGGTASGTCASSFGVCCVFSISCGSTSSQNNTYAIISSYSTSSGTFLSWFSFNEVLSDSDPCIYTFCKANSNVCKLRIDYDTMVLSDPVTISSTAVATDSTKIGDCNTDTLTVSSPGQYHHHVTRCWSLLSGHSTAPTICGYNTGQHMWVPASDQCSMINIDIDTGTTSTTRYSSLVKCCVYLTCAGSGRSRWVSMSVAICRPQFWIVSSITLQPQEPSPASTGTPVLAQVSHYFAGNTDYNIFD